MESIIKALETMAWVNSDWFQMPIWRFEVPMILGVIGAILLAYGIVPMSEIAKRHSNIKVAAFFRFSYQAGVCATMFCHGFFCIIGLVFKNMQQQDLSQVAQIPIIDDLTLQIFPIVACLMLFLDVLRV